MIKPSLAIPLPGVLNRYKEMTSAVNNLEQLHQMLCTYHSTAIEGNTLTWMETRMLLEKQVRIVGKPLEHQLMVFDHHTAQQQTLTLAQQHEPLNRTNLQAIAASVMRQTGGPTNTLLGTFDSRKGDYRTVSAMAGSRMFMDAKKISAAVDATLKELNTVLPQAKTVRQIYDLSFEIHAKLVAIHPFGDGNGRTARLVMNYVQHYHNLPISLVHIDERGAYINSLEESRKQQTSKPMLDFMYTQLTIFLVRELNEL